VAFTADYISVATSLGGGSATLAAFSKSLNVSGTGAGGMDTGAAPTSGFLSIYAIYNPASGSSALLGTTAGQTTIYGGSHMPVGYTMSALVAIWPTNGSADLVAGFWVDRFFSYAVDQGVLASGTATTPTAISLVSFVPAATRAIAVSAEVVPNSSGIGTILNVGATTAVSQLGVAGQVATVGNAIQVTFNTNPTASQTIYYANTTANAASSVTVTGYGI